MACVINEMLLEVDRCNLTMAGRELDNEKGIKVIDVESHDERFFFVLQNYRGTVVNKRKFPWIVEIVPRIVTL